jgi:transposase
VNEKLVILKNKLFGRSSEKSPSAESIVAHHKKQKDRKKKVQLPSLRYPDAPLIERHVELNEMPDCGECGSKMKDSGMTEDTEYLTVIPAQFYVVRQKCHKYCCPGCHGSLQTAPTPPRIKEGSSYSDEMMVDVAMSKYCDLIPVERYAAIAGRAGLEDLPANSLIETTHYVADAVLPVYEELKEEITESKVLHADETPHRMLEGDKDKKSYYLWGFSNEKSSYFEIKSTRSGEVASNLLADSKCEFLVSDVFSGYGKAVNDSNDARRNKSTSLPLIKNIYCNAHARRKFKEAETNTEDAAFFITQYKRIYLLDALGKKKPEKMRKCRDKMEIYYKKMKGRAEALVDTCSSKSSLGKALNYFLKNYDAFTFFKTTTYLPLDNNSQERLMRNPVIGRKTWYGTHSKRGAKTAAILFSIVESCKLNQVNPREYLRKLIQDIQAGKRQFTPAQFKAAVAPVTT